MVEAYLGAIFVDSGFEFEVVEKFYQSYVKPYFEDMGIYDTFANKHPTVRSSYISSNCAVEANGPSDIFAQQIQPGIRVYQLLPESRGNICYRQRDGSRSGGCHRA